MLVRPRSTRHRFKSHDAIVMMLVVLGSIAGLGTIASGSTVTASSHPAERHDGHQCKCKSCRGLTSCCCSPARSKSKANANPPARPETPPTAPEPGEGDAGPCLSSAPCGGGEGLPTSSTGLTLSKAVALTDLTMVRPSLAARSHFDIADSIRSAVLAARLDDPPEGFDSVCS